MAEDSGGGVDKSALPQNLGSSPVKPNLKLEGSEQVTDYWDRRTRFESGENVQAGSDSTESITKSSDVIKGSFVPLTGKAKAWVEKHYGPSMAQGSHYSGWEDMLNKHPGSGRYYQPGMRSSATAADYGDIKKLADMGLIEDVQNSRWNHEALARQYDKEVAEERAAAQRVHREKVVNEVLGALPTPQKSARAMVSSEPTRDRSNKKAYWESYYNLPPEVRNTVQPGMKKAWYDILNKALASAGM